MFHVEHPALSHLEACSHGNPPPEDGLSIHNIVGMFHVEHPALSHFASRSQDKPRPTSSDSW